MAEQEKTKDKKRGKNTHLVDSSDLIILDGLNVRRSLPQIEELAEDIARNGIQTPLKSYYDPVLKKYVVVIGHRRKMAIDYLVEKGYEMSEIPTFTYPKKPTDEEILRDHITSNSGVPLSALEKAEVCRRMEALGYKAIEISEKLGFTVQQIYNFLKLAESPEEIKDLIHQGVVKSTVIVEMFKELKDWDLLQERVKALLLENAERITGASVKKAFSQPSKEEDSNSTDSSASITKNNAPEDDTEFRDAKTKHQSSFLAPKKVTFEARVLSLRDELELKLSDPKYDQYLIEKFMEAIDLLQDDPDLQISVVVDSIFASTEEKEEELEEKTKSDSDTPSSDTEAEEEE